MKSVDDGEAEVQIFDNGSSDGTPEFLRQSQKNLPNGTIMLSKNNLGQSVSRNKLCQAAKGDFVLFRFIRRV
jgi:glycosyltransferase involved in cell wall biosynthesis